MSENQFRNPNFIFWMLRNINAIAIVGHDNRTIFLNGYINVGNWYGIFYFMFDCLQHSHDMVPTIYNSFVKQLKQSWNHFHVFFNNSVCRYIEYPLQRIDFLYRTNICIWIVQNMLAVGFLLVLVG